MKTKLITALRTAAKALEEGTIHYDWEQPNSCNCGVVACALLGESVAGLKTRISAMRTSTQLLEPEDRNTWRGMARLYCPITGIPENDVMRALVNAGLSAKDIVELERLQNPKVLERMSQYQVTDVLPKTFFQRIMFQKPSKKVRITKEWQDIYTSKICVIEYFRIWAHILEEEGRDDMVPQASSKEVANA